MFCWRLEMDAKQPFLVETPKKIYETSQIDVDAIFTLASMVSSNSLLCRSNRISLYIFHDKIHVKSPQDSFELRTQI